MSGEDELSNRGRDQQDGDELNWVYTAQLGNQIGNAYGLFRVWRRQFNTVRIVLA
jgi:hypothetical protein